MKLSELMEATDTKASEEFDALFCSLPLVDASVGEIVSEHCYYDGPCSGEVAHDGRNLYFHWWWTDSNNHRQFVLVEASAAEIAAVIQARDLGQVVEILGHREIVGRWAW